MLFETFNKIQWKITHPTLMTCTSTTGTQQHEVLIFHVHPQGLRVLGIKCFTENNGLQSSIVFALPATEAASCSTLLLSRPQVFDKSWVTRKKMSE
jgi:hypothetical protein